jgi:hypothetical protein
MTIVSLSAFSCPASLLRAYLHSAHSPTLLLYSVLIFIPRILLMRLKIEEGAERKCNPEEIL